MDPDVVADFAYIATFLAERGDADLEDDELRVLLDAVGRLGHAVGMAPEAAKKAGFHAAQACLVDQEGLGKREMAAGVLERVDRLGAHIALLPGLYEDLVQVAAADGHSEADEGTILRIVRSRWGLG